MRHARLLLPALALVLLALALPAVAPAKLPPPGYVQARAEVAADGREVARLLAAGDARALHARFDPRFAATLPLAELERFLASLRAAAPIGERLDESAMPLDETRRLYSADHAWGPERLALQVSLDGEGRVTGLLAGPRRSLPPDPAADRPPVRLRLPLRGTWWVFWGGRDELRNYHVVAPDQRHALDLVRWRDGGTARGDGTRNAQYHAWGRRVLAPADATVVVAADGVRDNRPQVEVANPDAPAGNHVLLALPSGEHVLLAHLREGSVRVRPGQRVRAGQVLGRVGNSGNSSEPHLHLQVQDSPVPLSGTGLPVAFGPVRVDSERRASAELVQGQFVRARR